MAVSFAERRKQAEKDGLLSSGDYLKLKEGSNRLRLMSECLPHPSEYQGKKTFKWLCYVIDRVDGKVKPFFMPHTIYKQIEALQLEDDYAFSDLPMPYDLTVNAKGAGTKDVEYTVMPARKNTNITDAEMDDYEARKPIAELQATLKAKKGETVETPQHQPPPPDDDHGTPVTDDEIPFMWLLALVAPSLLALHTFLA